MITLAYPKRTIIALENRAGELDRVTIHKRDATDEEIKHALLVGINQWTVQVGDVIRIFEE